MERKGVSGSFLGDENILHLDKGMGHTGVNAFQTSSNSTLKICAFNYMHNTLQ